MHVTATEIAAVGGSLASGNLALAMIREMPEKFPATIQELWAYLRNALQQYLCIKGLNEPSPSQPEGRAN